MKIKGVTGLGGFGATVLGGLLAVAYSRNTLLDQSIGIQSIGIVETVKWAWQTFFRVGVATFFGWAWQTFFCQSIDIDKNIHR